MAHDVTLITGDGTGPELAEAARMCVDATGVKINWDVQEAGVDVMARLGTPLPDSVLASVRPCKYYPGVRSYFSEVGVDIVIVRENTEDLYAGVEFEAGKPNTAELIEVINKLSTDKKIKTKAEETGVSIKPISKSGTERIVRCAFDYARKNKRKKVTAVHKANIMKYSDGLYLHTAQA